MRSHKSVEMPCEKVSFLRSVLAKPGLSEAAHLVPLGYGPVDAALKGGLKRGALHEVFASAGHEAAATGFAAGLVSRLAQDKLLFWIGQNFASQEHGGLCPTGLFEFGLDPARLVFLSVVHAQEALRAAGDALTCTSLGVVIIEITGTPKVLDLAASRRLILACAQHSVSAILLRFGAVPQNSAAETRWRVNAALSAPAGDDWGHPVFDVSLVRNRNGRTGQWVFAWSCDDGCFKNATAASGAVVSAPSGRQA